MKTKLILTISLILSLAACSSLTPTQQANITSAIGNLTQGAVDYASGNDVGAAVNGIQGASYFLRSLQSTPNAANPNAVVAAVTSGTVPNTSQASPKLAALGAMTASAVSTLVANGTPPDTANEQAAKALDAAVIQITGPTQASLPVRNAAFRNLSRADQRDATILFADERKTLTFAANPTAKLIQP